MVKVDEANRESSKSMIQKMKLSTCKYGKKGKKIRCVETPRVKVVEMVQKDTGKGLKDSKSVSIILQPVGEKGVGMLTFDYDDPDQDTDTWLYLSALGKVKRMISGSEDDDSSESGSFFGTEFTIDDMEMDVKSYTYKILKETTYRKRPVWIIESIPNAKKARKTPYSKSISWIDMERLLTLKVNLYNRAGKLHKRMVVSKVEKINGIWTGRKTSMNNLIKKRVTNMTLGSIAFNIDVPDQFLTKRTLTDFTFRERELGKLRASLK